MTTTATEADPHVAAAEVFAAMADATRLRLLAVMRKGEQHVTALAEQAGTDVGSAGHHLKMLKYAGLVAQRRDGRFMRYSLSALGQRAAGIAGKLAGSPTPAEAV